MLTGLRVVEFAGSDCGATCCAMLRRSGARTVIVDADESAFEPGTWRDAEHEGAWAIGLAGLGADERDRLLTLVAACAHVVVGPAGLRVPGPPRSGRVEVVAPPWERRRREGRRTNTDVWAAELGGATMAVEAVASLLGAGGAAVAATRTSLLSGTAFPLPGTDRQSTRDRTGTASEGGARWPAAGGWEASDGWVIAGPTRLPLRALSALVDGPADPTPAEAEAALADWIRQGTRADRTQRLQSWRTSVTPVLDVREARALQPDAYESVRSARWEPTPHRELEMWLELSPGELDLVVPGAGSGVAA